MKVWFNSGCGEGNPRDVHRTISTLSLSFCRPFVCRLPGLLVASFVGVLAELTVANATTDYKDKCSMWY